MRGLGLLGVWEGWEGDGGEHWVVRTGPRHSFSPLRDHQYLKSKTRELQWFSAETQNHAGSMFDCKQNCETSAPKGRSCSGFMFLGLWHFSVPPEFCVPFFFPEMNLQKLPKRKPNNVNAKHQMYLIEPINHLSLINYIFCVKYFMYFCVFVTYFCGQLLITNLLLWQATSDLVTLMPTSKSPPPPFKMETPYLSLINT